ncbi:MAG: efflux RND transporter periplasmic adaptor subunit [Steroidobacteraceae bacterium]
MRFSVVKLRPNSRRALFAASGAIALVMVGAALYSRSGAQTAPAPLPSPPAAARSRPDPDSIKLTDAQLSSIKTGTVADREFVVQKETVGNIDFNEDRSVQVFTPYQGRIIQALANLGDEVKKDQVLFTIESPDFIAAQSNLISAAATLDQTSSALNRAKALYAVKGIDQNDYETAVANQQSAEGALRAARNAVAIFGKTESEIDRIIATRRVETALVIKSPITGAITARNAAPGLLEQPGNVPAPYSVADLSTMWMLANVPEADIPQFKRGQLVTVSVAAYPGRVFEGSITALGATVDPNSRRVMVRSEIKDPKHELRSQMFATFVIRTGVPERAPAVPLSGIVREGDGTMSIWVVGSDPHWFTRRAVKIGHQQDGYDEILDGIKSGETVAIDGAIFLSNILYGGAS